MPDSVDPRYDELLRGLQLGALPPWVPQADRDRLLLLSEGHRMAIASAVAAGFPRASYYATALFGAAAFLDGVAGALVAMAPCDRSIQDKARSAAQAWSETVGRPDLVEQFTYDALLGPLGEHPPYRGPDRDHLRVALSLPEEFSVASFEYDVAGFALLLERLQARSAPVETTRTYRPAPKKQRLVFYRAGEERLVRTIDPS